MSEEETGIILKSNIVDIISYIHLKLTLQCFGNWDKNKEFLLSCCSLEALHVLHLSPWMWMWGLRFFIISSS